jgi:diadenosine tetraphosphate (Ap4A) HIT family hydrolase
MTCELCSATGGELLWQNERLRIVAVDDAHYPGFCRVIWRDHVAEMTDLADAEQLELMRAVWATERAIRRIAQPDKVNLASLGNMVPHLHWHVIPRWRDDLTYPQPVWSAPQNAAAPVRRVDRHRLAEQLLAALSQTGLRQCPAP